MSFGLRYYFNIFNEILRYYLILDAKIMPYMRILNREEEPETPPLNYVRRPTHLAHYQIGECNLQLYYKSGTTMRKIKKAFGPFWDDQSMRQACHTVSQYNAVLL